MSGSVGNWRQDGREIIFQALDGKMMTVEVKLGATIEVGIPKLLFPLQSLISGSRFAMSGDGLEFIIPMAPQSGNRPSVTTVLDWAACIKK